MLKLSNRKLAEMGERNAIVIKFHEFLNLDRRFPRLGEKTSIHLQDQTKNRNSGILRTSVLLLGYNVVPPSLTHYISGIP